MTLNTARRLLKRLSAAADTRPLTKREREIAVCLRATIRRLTGNHYAA